MNKVILTQKQADAIVRNENEGLENSDILYRYLRFDGYDEQFRGLTFGALADALYIGYEVEPEFVSFDKAVKALEEGKAVYFHDGEWETKIIYGEYLGDGELSGYTMTQLIKGRWSIGRER